MQRGETLTPNPKECHPTLTSPIRGIYRGYNTPTLISIDIPSESSMIFRQDRPSQIFSLETFWKRGYRIKETPAAFHENFDNGLMRIKMQRTGWLTIINLICLSFLNCD